MSQVFDLRALIDHARYPIDEPDNPARQAGIERIRAELATDGCAVLKNFLSAEGLQQLLSEAEARAPQAYFSPSKRTNAYFSADDPSLPEDHPRRIFMERSNGFITKDLLDPSTACHQLYYWPPLARFLADCLGKPELHIYADPISNMIVNVGVPGSRFNWHFDTNEFTITLLLRPARSGGHFEYAPNLRSADDECYDDVSAVLRGDRQRVIRLALEPGDLQFFLGRFSLHQVTENTGDSDRLLLIMSFCEQPGVIGSVHRIRELYGKVTEAHLEAERHRVRSDRLMD